VSILKKIIQKIDFKINFALAFFYSKKILIDFDENWFYGKRVAIVGGGNSVLNEKLGKYIDDFDVVVRINKGVELIKTQSEYVGRRTDFLFHCLYEDASKGGSPTTPELWREYGVNKLVFSLNYKYSIGGLYHFISFLKRTNKNFKFSQIPKHLFYKNLDALHLYEPTTGFIAINTIFNCTPKELYITGITFFKTENNQDYRKVTQELKDNLFKFHNPELEYCYVRSLFESNPKVVIPDITLRYFFERDLTLNL
jgi:hypothetical protein